MPPRVGGLMDSDLTGPLKTPNGGDCKGNGTPYYFREI